ncbi:mTERF domain-containing protein 1, mitochondrial [Atta colombica]|uniref:mTERF domain-containing protein 1, mitochondrial n=1 Tax=Atta colombica TaxID=520822 RepID=A0A195BCG9_9HYME|nr:PREDICTED: transcription termination factor 3, mitochondrial [Atta colombica]KYM81917.1 mTERF domain-containing protein 1, mitochondrial [Atta colombica]
MFQRCCSLVLTARPVAVDLIRFVSRSGGSRQCVSRKLERDVERASSKSSVLSESPKTDENYALELRLNLNNNANIAREDYLDDSDIKLPHPLDICTEDLSDIGPPLTPTFSFAKYANKSCTIRKLVDLGVSLYKFETKEGMVEYILNLDFDRDVKPYIRFLHDCGVPMDYLGTFITKNPNIFKEDMDDLHTRIRYLRAHNFNVLMIKTIICKNPNWLSFSTKDIDGRLGYFQSNFKLYGNEVRNLTVKGPKVVTFRMIHLMENTFSIREEMGFDQMQVKKLLLTLPRLWSKNRDRLLSTFDYAHNEMQLQHDFIVRMPHILLCRKTRLQQRHLFLVEMKKAQYNPSKPMYVSPLALVSGTDIEFCRDIAKTSVDIYNAFLKTF